MRYVSLFSGIEAATVAFEPLGWEPLAFAEIDPFPCAVLEHRYPNVPNLGDVCEVDWSEFLERHGSVDLVVGGSPCQSFSIAGGRDSLDGESRLMFEYIRAVEELRPTWLLWENVPGVLSVRDNAFGQLLGELSDIGYGLAWRVLDAQFFGVAQRRRRVFLVGHLGAGGASAAVLFDAESVRGNSQPSREKRKELAGAAGIGAPCGGFKWHQGADAGGIGYENEQSPTLTADWHNPAVMAFDTTQITAPKNGSRPQFGDECHTLNASAHAPAIALQSDGSTSINSHGCGYQTDGSAYTLNCIDRQSVVCVADDNANAATDVDMCGSLKVGGGVPWIASR